MALFGVGSGAVHACHAKRAGIRVLPETAQQANMHAHTEAHWHTVVDKKGTQSRQGNRRQMLTETCQPICRVTVRVCRHPQGFQYPSFMWCHPQCGAVDRKIIFSYSVSKEDIVLTVAPLSSLGGPLN